MPDMNKRVTALSPKRESPDTDYSPAIHMHSPMLTKLKKRCRNCQWKRLRDAHVRKYRLTRKLNGPLLLPCSDLPDTVDRRKRQKSENCYQSDEGGSFPYW